MKILLNIMQYDYGDKARGYSFEYENFYITLSKMGHEVEVFDYLTIHQQQGRTEMNRKLLAKVKENNYDFILTSLYTDEFSAEFLNVLKLHSRESVVWMNDDQWRWESLGRKVCFSFHHVVTTDPDAVSKYHAIGYKAAILSQFACNDNLFKKMHLKKDIDVSFVGQPNPWRRYVVEYLMNRGINIQCFGYGWPNSRVTTEEMVAIFNRSKINLNLSNSVQYDLGYLTSINLTWNKNLSLVRNLYNLFGPQINTLLSPKKNEQIKARVFEITGAGGFALTYPVKHLNKYFLISREIETYSNIKELLYKIQYFLANDKKREDVAQAGYKRSLNEHTYSHRFNDIFVHI